MDILERILGLMKYNDISGNQLASQLGERRGIVTDWKSGRSNTYTGMLPEIAKILNTTVAYLVGETNDPKQQSDEPTKEDWAELKDALDNSVFSDMIKEMTPEQRKGFAHMLVDYMNQNEEPLEAMAKSRGFWPEDN